MKKLILILSLITSFAFAGVLEESYKIYPLNAENLFLNAKKLESNFDRNITFYEFKKLAKKFLKEKKLEDFEVASDGRITKINNF